MSTMSALLKTTVFYAHHLSEDKLRNANDYLRFLYEQDRPLDEFDYDLAARADSGEDQDTVSFDAVLSHLKVTDAGLQD